MHLGNHWHWRGIKGTAAAFRHLSGRGGRCQGRCCIFAPKLAPSGENSGPWSQAHISAMNGQNCLKFSVKFTLGQRKWVFQFWPKRELFLRNKRHISLWKYIQNTSHFSNSQADWVIFSGPDFHNVCLHPIFRITHNVLEICDMDRSISSTPCWQHILLYTL